ncbi:MAG: hypothetical protein ACRD35_05955 [Candidatus Acidiferrales bacterium]
MRRTLLFLLVAVVWAGVAGRAQAPPTAGQAPADARAMAAVDEMMKAMGGPGGWEQTRYLRFDWVVEREGKQVAYVKHLWDRYQGRYRVEWESKEGKKMAALFNVNTRTGHVWVNGQPASPEEEKKYLDTAYGRFINDSYWLLMPWKLKDPGVNLKYAGETEMNGEKCDLVEVSFGKVGLTPGDHYWAYINRRTHMMDRWAYFLQDYEGKPALDKATPWEWRDWEMVGTIRLAREKAKVGEKTRIYFPLLTAPAQVDAQVFESLAMPMPGPPAPSH